jgi:hypothetical protein
MARPRPSTAGNCERATERDLDPVGPHAQPQEPVGGEVRSSDECRKGRFPERPPSPCLRSISASPRGASSRAGRLRVRPNELSSVGGRDGSAAPERRCLGGCDLCAQAGRTSRRRWRRRPPETSVFDEDSSKPDMLINRLSSGATRADLPARRSVSSRHGWGDSAVPGQMSTGRVPKPVVFRHVSSRPYVCRNRPLLQCPALGGFSFHFAHALDGITRRTSVDFGQRNVSWTDAHAQVKSRLSSL